MRHIILLLTLLTSGRFHQQTMAQSCSKEALHAKYWQYKKNLNRHFMVMDRDPSGCIQDGIGQSQSDPCICSKNGYGLPATSIEIRQNGKIHDALRDRLEPAGGVFYDPRCADDDNNPTNNHFDKHNFLDMGSETPHQMGWHWATMATEYKSTAMHRVCTDLWEP